MSSELAIQVEGLGKLYRIGRGEARYRTFRDTFMDALAAPFRRVGRLLSGHGSVADLDETIWALKDVSFEVKRGEVVGIIGRNGAGKSTLLKVLSRITEPTEGWADIHGRVASLLEVGTGFHPELTGRENIYLNGSILGMKRAEIDRHFDEIVEFAEIAKFIDTPVKHYSSGMYVRLAFAVAAHLEPEILLVDEVLSVGDVAFQRKCLGKMGDVAAGGRTVMFVSHNMGAVGRLCPTAILLEGGIVASRGETADVVGRYLANDGSNAGGSMLNAIAFSAPTLRVSSLKINGETGRTVTLAADQRVLTVEVEGRLEQPAVVELEVRFYDSQSMPLGFYSPGHQEGERTAAPRGHFRLERIISLPKITRGDYLLSLALTDPMRTVWMNAPHACRLIAQGSTTATGRSLDYAKGNGWVLLP
jgi:lipopolysaccharide transport system ATP-binding protein